MTNSSLYRKLRARTFIFFGHLVLILLRCLKPFIKIKLALLSTDRFGELAVNTDIYIRRKMLGLNEKAWVIFIPFFGVCCNKQLVDMYKRILTVIDIPLVSEWFMRCQSLIVNTEFYHQYPFTQTQCEVFANSLPVLKFTEAEKEKGQQFLNKVGLGKDDWFVCLFVRDNAYLRSHLKNIQGAPVTDDNNGYRDVDIMTHLKACEFITSKGGWVIRLGHTVAKDFKIDNPRVVDYAKEYRTDFLDVYLISQSRFVLGTPSGGCDLATNFGVPKLATNYIPFGLKPFGANDIYIPKLLKDKEGNYLSFRKILQSDTYKKLNSIRDYESAGIIWEDNLSEDIYLATIEMWERISGIFELDDEGKCLLEKYFEMYQPKDYFYKSRSSVAISFLKKYRQLFFD